MDFDLMKFMSTRGTVYHYTVHFVTIDGNNHTFTKYNYAARDNLICTVPEYIMTDIKSDGYLYDDNMTMYPLNNIISISWECDDIIEGIPLKENKIFYEIPKYKEDNKE